ncbi:MAG TPA: TonB-dependent receptor, partial [Ignavibacteriaceae bacterium]|nr:TonB-dependent receptor [Ignavibacteriaceae bacterium]
MEISNEKEIFTSSYSTPSDILKNKPGLAVAHDGIWGTYLTIRGLSKNNIVSLIDGNRIETSNDIAAGLSLIEINDVNRIEVIKSAVSSLYGSGALGGVVNIITEKGFYPETFRLNVSAISSFSSVNKNSSGTISFNLGDYNWFLNLRGTLRDADDVETPDGILKNSQFKNKNYSIFSGINFSDDQELKISYQNYLAEDVGIPGNSLFTSNAEVKYLKAERNLASIEYNIKNIFPAMVNLQTKLFFQEIQRDVENKPNTVSLSNNGRTRTSVLKITPNGNHKTIGASLQSNWLFNDKHFLITGFEVWQRELKTNRERELFIETIDTNSQTVTNSIHKIIGEVPIPSSKYLSLGFFAQDEYEIIKDKFKLFLGGRIDQIQVHNDDVYNPLYEIVNDSINFNPASKKKNWKEDEAEDFSWSSNLSILYSITQETDLTFAAAHSFRSPSLEERYQYIDLGSFVRVGNPQLQPEKGYFFDAGLKYWGNDFTFSGNIFYNLLNNLVAEQPGTFEGRSAFIKTNIGKARLYGFDFGFEYSPYKNYSVAGILSSVNGEDIENNSYLPQIPPLNGRLFFSTSTLDFFKLNLASTFFADQNKTAPGEIGTPGFITYDLQLIFYPLNISSA